MQTIEGHIKAADVVSGDTVSILLTSFSVHNNAADEQLLGTVMDTTPKALRVQFEAVRGATRSMWLPRRALTHTMRDRTGVQSKLARWWRPDDRQAVVLDRCTHVVEVQHSCAPGMRSHSPQTVPPSEAAFDMDSSPPAAVLSHSLAASGEQLHVHHRW